MLVAAVRCACAANLCCSVAACDDGDGTNGCCWVRAAGTAPVPAPGPPAAVRLLVARNSAPIHSSHVALLSRLPQALPVFHVARVSRRAVVACTCGRLRVCLGQGREPGAAVRCCARERHKTCWVTRRKEAPGPAHLFPRTGTRWPWRRTLSRSSTVMYSIDGVCFSAHRHTHVRMDRYRFAPLTLVQKRPCVGDGCR